MKAPFLLRHGIRIAGLSALASVALFTVVTVLSYQTDQRFIDLWEGYRVSEEQLFKLRVDANRLFEIEHRLSVGGVNLDVELKQAGTELTKVPSLKAYANRKLEILKQARQHLLRNHDSRARSMLNGAELMQVNKALREALYSFELNERERLQAKLDTRLDSQTEILRFDVAAIMLAVILLISASVLVVFYIERLRRFDRDIIVARNEAERASRMKSSFLANMSHEIRTPLNGVLGLTRLLRETKIDKEQQELVESLEASGRTLLSIVNDILDLSKIESGKIELENTDFDAHDLVLDLEKAFSPVADRKGISLIVDGPKVVVPVCGDPVKVRQVLQNLVSNALKFTKEGEVRLRWRVEPGPALRFEVKDTGIGIPTDSMHRIFHPFEQADSSTSRHYGGSGLGLAICRHLVEAMGGKLGVESRVGLGSRFWFTVPCRPGRLEAVKATVSPVTPPQPLGALTFSGEGGGARVLLVEDNEVNQHLVVTFLKRRGFEVDAAVNGVVALEKLRANPFDLILMDAHLPEMDGFEATRRIRRGEAGQKAEAAPIIALTASAIKGERERCLSVGMNDYLTKPVDLQQLEKTVRSYLGMGDMKSGSKKSEASVAPVLAATAKGGTPVRPNDLDEELYQDLVAIFLRITPDREKDLRQAIEKKDDKSVGKLAHTMKSSAAQLGLNDLASICKKMELKGLSGSSDEWPDLMAEFDRSLEAVYAKLKAEAPASTATR
ncbi:MAG: response regulator [Bdellovibrionaceae bacterium]|nr:response regulator [Pseudobdellovibrionaceae bacterium]